MMKATASPLLRPSVESLDESLERIARTGDMDALRSLLLGRGLPVLGGDAEPVEVLMQALGPSQAPAGLSQALGALLAAEVTGLTQEGATQDRRMLLRGALRLAAGFPPQADLFGALKTLASSLDAKVDDLWSGDPLGPLVARALAYQQSDGAMEDFWLHLLRMSSHKTWTPERRTVMLTAWRGLLRASPSEETRLNGKVVDVDRIERGLLALYAGVRGREGGGRLIRLALGVLAETFPRSPQFWEERLGLRVVQWPDELREETLRKWPGLRTSKSRKLADLPTVQSEPQKFPAMSFRERANLNPGRDSVSSPDLKLPFANVNTTNNTDDDTEYRTMPRSLKDREQQSRTKSQPPEKEPGWIVIPARQTTTIPHPSCPFVVEFRVRGKVICSKVLHSPVSRITLVKAGDTYKCRSVQRTAEQKPEPKPKQPKPRNPMTPSEAPARAYDPDRRTRRS
jgi:hypothetical protein